MPVAAPQKTHLLTWDEYLREGTVQGAYSIVDGLRQFAMAGASFEHQEIVLNLAELLRRYQRTVGAGRTLVAPFDVVITRDPLSTRQPDVLFVTNEALTRVGGIGLATPLTVAPALVIEVLSENETRRERAAKILDYCRLGVPECWVVEPGTVELLRLIPSGPESVGIVGRGGSIRSLALPGLNLPVNEILGPLREFPGAGSCVT